MPGTLLVPSPQDNRGSASDAYGRRNRQAIAVRKTQVAARAKRPRAGLPDGERGVVFMLSEPASALRREKHTLTRNRAGAQRHGKRFVVGCAS